MSTIWLDTTYACGSIEYDDETGKILRGAPIFTERWKGQNVRAMLQYLKATNRLRRWQVSDGTVKTVSSNCYKGPGARD